MAGANLLALIDDIATLLDDVALMTKTAAQKTAGVLGDDLAVNAEQVTGSPADRELPVVWAVFKGSLLNKLILVPAALLISAFIPSAITPILMLGGAYLCYEGSEKVVHFFLHKNQHHHEDLRQAIVDVNVDMVAFEKEKIRGAVRTDFVLSAEIIAISLGVVAQAPLITQIVTLSIVALLITVGVYGLVAGIVKMDDLGFYLNKKKPPAKQIGKILISAAPKLMKFLSVAGTAAMFLVGGGILVHGFPFLAHAIETLADHTGAFATMFNHASTALLGLIIGLGLVVAITFIQKLKHS